MQNTISLIFFMYFTRPIYIEFFLFLNTLKCHYYNNNNYNNKNNNDKSIKGHRENKTTSCELHFL